MNKWNMTDEHHNPVNYACLMLHSMGLSNPHLSQNNQGNDVIAFEFNSMSIFNPYMTENGFDTCKPSDYELTDAQANALCHVNDALGFNWGL